MSVSVGELLAYLRLESSGFDAKIRSAQSEMGAAAGAADRMEGAVGASGAALAGAGRQAGVASTGTAKFRAAQLSAVAATERYNAVLADGNASLARRAAAEAAVIRANERVIASSPAESIRSVNVAAAETPGLMDRAGAGFLKAGKMALGLGAAFGAFELAKKTFEFVSAGKVLTDELNTVQAVSRATDKQMMAVRAQVIALGKDLKVPGATAIDAANAIMELVKAGISLPRAMQAARSALLLASSTQTDMADTARVLGDTMDIWSIKGPGAGHAAAILASAALGASHNLVGLFDAIKQAGPSSQALKINLDDTATALVYLAKHGLSTEMGGTGLKVMLSTLAKDTPKSVEALHDLGVAAFDAQGKFVGYPKLFDQLHGAYGRFGNDSKRFEHDLVGAFGTRGMNVAALFAKGVGKDFDDLKKHLEAGNLQHFADLQNRGVAAGFRQLNKEATAAGIDIYQHLEPAGAMLVDLVGHALPGALALAAHAVAPFVAGWHAVDGAVMPVVHTMGDLLGMLHPVLPVLKFLATDVLATWAAFKGYQIVRYAMNAIGDGLTMVRTKAGAGLASVRTSGLGMQNSMSLSAAVTREASTVMQAEFDKIAAAALESAAAVDRAAAVEAVAYADMIAASKTASDAQVLAADEAAAAATAQARTSALAAATTAAAAKESAAAIDEAGVQASIGWAGVAGPLLAVGVGVGLLVSLFHHSSSASKEATAAAKAYTDALHDDSGKTTVVDAITKQLSDNKIPSLISKLNKELGSTQFTGTQFVNAILRGGKPLQDLRAHLESVVKAGTTVSVSVGRAARATVVLTPAAENASKALKHLNTEYDGLTKAAKKDLLDTKTFAGASSSVDKLSDSTKVGSTTAKNYAEMLGIVVDKNGIAAVSAKTLQAAVDTVSSAYDKATQTGDDYLKAVSTFSSSAGTAADRASLIGATLKAANGDALSFAGAMTAAASANRDLVNGFASDNSKIADLKKQISDYNASVSGSGKGNELLAAQIGKTSTSIKTNKDRIAELNNKIASGKLTTSQLAAAHRELDNAQATGSVSAARLSTQQKKLHDSLSGAGIDTSKLADLQKQLADAYENSEHAAINLDKGTIDYAKGGAPALVGQLQAIQDASLKAASATYQHELATTNAKSAADHAFAQYKSQTQGTLIDEAKKLGLTHDQAKKLADTYFGLAHEGDIKKTIEMAGANPVVDVLNRIGRLLAALTGGKWDIPVTLKMQVASSRALIKADPTLGASVGADGLIHLKGGGKYASGGLIRGPGSGTSDTAGLFALSNREFVSTAKSVLKNYAALEAGNRGAQLEVAGTHQAPAAVGSTREGDRHFHIGDFHVEQRFPEPEPGGPMLPHAMDSMANALDGF